MNSYKQEHERFVSGHNGTTVLEIAVLTLTPCASLLVRDILLLMNGLHGLPFWPRVIFDFSLVMVPTVLMNTVLSDVTTTVSVILYTVAASSCLLALLSLNRANLSRNFRKVVAMEMESQRSFLNYTRSLMNLSTAIVILGVDFTAFPRRLAKTESFGTGYMDIGVGCFVISNALVCPEARGKQQHCQSINEFFRRVLSSLQSSFPLLILGVGRLLAVKGIEYHEHVSEYGVHWNFFFTLAIVKVFSTAMLCVCPVQLSSALAVVVISVYQYALSARGLGSYILHGSDGKGSRLNLLDANREGLLSCFGYVCLYLVGVQIGGLLFSKRMQTFKDWVKKFWILLTVSTAGYVCQSLSSVYIQPTSRRMANLPFVFWIIGLSAQVLWSCLAVDLTSTAVTALVLADRKKTDIPRSERQMLSSPKMKSATPCLLQAVNTNGLFFFLMSNVLTGLINICMHTHHASVSVAVSILLVYTFSLSAIIVFMDKRKIITKIW